MLQLHTSATLYLGNITCPLFASYVSLDNASYPLWCVDTRIHQLNENVDSTSGLEYFQFYTVTLSYICQSYFIIYLGWIVNSAMSVYVTFYIFQNGTTNKYERCHFKPNFATYKCISMPPPHFKVQSKYQCKLQYFTIKYAMSSHKIIHFNKI